MRDLISFNEHNASYYNRRMIFFLISLCRQIMKHSARLLETSYNAEELCCNMVIFSFCLLNTFPLYWISDSPYLIERKECRLSIYHSFSLSSLPISCFFALGLSSWTWPSLFLILVNYNLLSHPTWESLGCLPSLSIIQWVTKSYPS